MLILKKQQNKAKNKNKTKQKKPHGLNFSNLAKIDDVAEKTDIGQENVWGTNKLLYLIIDSKYDIACCAQAIRSSSISLNFSPQHQAVYISFKMQVPTGT